MQNYCYIFLLLTCFQILLPMRSHQMMLNRQLIGAVTTHAPSRHIVTLINRGAHPASGIIPAIEQGNVNLFKFLMRNPVHVRTLNNELITTKKLSLISRAITSPRCKNIIKILSAYGIKPTIQDYQNAYVHNVDLIDLLIKYGMSADTPVDKYNRSALMSLAIRSETLCTFCIRHYRKRIVQLLERGADIDHTDIDDKTALILCVEKTHPPYRVLIAHCLLKQGANPLIKDKTGKTALDYAPAATDICQLLCDSIYTWINT